MRVVIIAFSLLVASAFSGASFAVAVDDKPLVDPAQEAAARALMKEIRCLVCQNQSIEDSNADLAKDLRHLVRERVSAGDTAAEVRAFLVARYGDWVLLEPPFNQMTLFLWGSPFLILLLVVVGVYSAGKKSTSEPLSRTEKARIKKLLKGGDVT